MASKSPGYGGNPHLPFKNTTYNYTPHQAAELAKCIKDPVYFAETYFKIISVDHGLIPFKLYDFQAEAASLYLKSRKMMLATSRQIGKTSIATVIVLHYALFNSHKKIFLLANKADTALEILSRIQLAYEYLPKWLKSGIVEWNKSTVQFDNGTSIAARSSSSDSIRGQSCSLLYIDECAFVQNWDEFSASVLPVLSSGKDTKMIFTSTPNGLNHFYRYYEGAKKIDPETGKSFNGFDLIEVKWNEVPGRDAKWKEETLQTLNYDMMRFAQEYEVQFLGSSGTLISGYKLKELFADVQQPIHYNQGFEYKVYKEPIAGHKYVIICDVSRGKGLDYSAFQVIDVSQTPYKQVAVFRNNMIVPRDYASFIYNTAKGYNNAYVLIEINDIGGQVSDLIAYDFGYENLIYTESAGSKGKRVSNGYGSNIDSGIRTSKTVKGLGCSMLKLLLEQNKLDIVDKNTIDELAVFSQKGQSYEAEQGYHDDTVMCLVLFAWLTTDDFFAQLTDGNIMHSLRDLSDEQVMETLTPFGVISNGLDDEPELVKMGDDLWEAIPTTVDSLGMGGFGFDDDYYNY